MSLNPNTINVRKEILITSSRPLFRFFSSKLVLCSGPSTNMATVGHHAFFVLSHLLCNHRRYFIKTLHMDSSQLLDASPWKWSWGCGGLGGSLGCAVRLETRRSRVQALPSLATFFSGDWLWNIFCSYSLPSADSKRAVVSFWQKNVHNTG